MRQALTGCAAGIALLAASAAEAPAAELKVGLLLPYSGVYAALGQEIDDGFALALEQHGGDAAGTTFEIVREDTEAKPPVGLAKARKLVLEDEVDVLAGVVSSGVLGAIRDFVHESEMPLIVSNAGNDDATGERCSPYIVRVSFSNAQVNRPMGQWLYDQGVKKVYTLAPDYAAGPQMIATFSEALRGRRRRDRRRRVHAVPEDPGFRPLSDHRQGRGDRTASSSSMPAARRSRFVKQYDSFGLKADDPALRLGLPDFAALRQRRRGRRPRASIASLHYVPTLDTPENKAFVEAFKGKTGRIPSEYARAGL